MLSRLPGLGRPFKLRSDILAIIERKMREDGETTATQLLKVLNKKGYRVSLSTII
jgi:Fe2+ or Zn2+ uptake regulation protein